MSRMEYQQLGATGVFVSKLCLGTMTFGGSSPIFQAIGAIPQETADALVNESLGAGVNFFDTADVYADGESETMLGRALGSKRREVVIASKVFGRMGQGANDAWLSRLHILHAAEQSLKRMKTDYIDLYQIHGFDPLTPLEETLGALDRLVEDGKVRYIGCSNLAAWQIMKALGISAARGLEKFVTLQAYYSIAGRDIEREIVPMLNDQKLGLLPWSPLAGGFLTGKFTRGGASDQHARRNKFNFPPIDEPKAHAIVDAMEKIAKQRQASVAQIALAWLLHQPVVTSVIIGAKRSDQLQDNLGAINVKLDAEELKTLNDASALTQEYPGWMLNLPSTRRPGEQRDWSKIAKN